MAHRLCMAPTRSVVWSISFWSTSSVGWRSGAVTGTQTWERLMKWGNGKHGSKPGTGDDKTEIVVIADFWERTGGVFSADRDLSSNAFYIPWGGFDNRSVNMLGRIQ